MHPLESLLQTKFMCLEEGKDVIKISRNEFVKACELARLETKLRSVGMKAVGAKWGELAQYSTLLLDSLQHLHSYYMRLSLDAAVDLNNRFHYDHKLAAAQYRAQATEIELLMRRVAYLEELTQHIKLRGNQNAHLNSDSPTS